MVRRGEGGFFEFRLEMKNNVLPFFFGLFRGFHNLTTLGGGEGGGGQVQTFTEAN